VYLQVLILMSGMVFISRGFPPGSPGYDTLTAFVATVVITSTAAFVAFVAFEVFRSIKFAKLHEQSRAAEIERMERELLAKQRASRTWTKLKVSSALAGALRRVSEKSTDGAADPGPDQPRLGELKLMANMCGSSPGPTAASGNVVGVAPHEGSPSMLSDLLKFSRRKESARPTRTRSGGTGSGSGSYDEAEGLRSRTTSSDGGAPKAKEVDQAEVLSQYGEPSTAPASVPPGSRPQIRATALRSAGGKPPPPVLNSSANPESSAGDDSQLVLGTSTPQSPRLRVRLPLAGGKPAPPLLLPVDAHPPAAAAGSPLQTPPQHSSPAARIFAALTRVAHGHGPVRTRGRVSEEADAEGIGSRTEHRNSIAGLAALAPAEYD
jgi:hypothetical protein